MIRDFIICRSRWSSIIAHVMFHHMSMNSMFICSSWIRQIYGWPDHCTLSPTSQHKSEWNHAVPQQAVWSTRLSDYTMILSKLLSCWVCILSTCNFLVWVFNSMFAQEEPKNSSSLLSTIIWNSLLCYYLYDLVITAGAAVLPYASRTYRIMNHPALALLIE